METTHEKLRFRSQLLEKTSVLKSSKVRDLKPQFRSQLLEKTRVLNHALLARLKSQFLPSATATVATDSGITLTHVKTEGVIPPSLLKIQEVDYFLNQLKIQPIDTQPLITSQNSNSDFLTELNKINCLTPPKNMERDYLVTEPKIQLSGVRFSHLTFASHLLRNDKVQKANNGTITARISVTALLVSLLATCTSPSYANNNKVCIRVNEKNTKFSLRLNSKSEDSSQLEKINQLSFFEGFNCLDLVAVTGNNARQELRNLLKPVQHHTIVGVFLCLSFSDLPFLGKLCLALALARLWWGGRGNKPFGANTVCRSVLAVSNLPAALHLGQSLKKLPFEKV